MLMVLDDCRVGANRATRALMLISLLLCAGCSWQQPKAQKMDWHNSDAAQATVDLSAQQAVAAVERAVAQPPLSLPVESSADGAVVTGWKEYPGEIHIVRRWDERTRFRISVTPDFSNPTGRSRLKVEDQTEEKPSSAQPWYPAPGSRRPERSAEVLKQIVANLQAQPPQSGPTK
jgi:hypothetical protein